MAFLSLDQALAIGSALGLAGVIGFLVREYVFGPKLEIHSVQATERIMFQTVSNGLLQVDAVVKVRNVGRADAGRVMLVPEVHGPGALKFEPFTQMLPVTLRPDDEPRKFNAYAELVLPTTEHDIKAPLVDPRTLGLSVMFWVIADRGGAVGIMVAPQGQGTKAGEIHFSHVRRTRLQTRLARLRAEKASRRPRATAAESQLVSALLFRRKVLLDPSRVKS